VYTEADRQRTKTSGFYEVAQKASHNQINETTYQIVLKPAVDEIRYFVPLNCQTSAMILSRGVRYSSVPDLLCEVSYCA